MPVKKGSGGLDWQKEAKCNEPDNRWMQDYFFSPNTDKKYHAKNLCFSCDVRADCITWALENEEIWGIWGGRDENEIRRTLAVDADGNETKRGRFPQCPFCSARTSRLRTKTIDVPNGGRWRTARVVDCTVCGFQWKSRTSANAVDLYFTERTEKRERNQAARDKILAKEREKAAIIRAREREKEKIKRDRLREREKERLRREKEQGPKRPVGRPRKIRQLPSTGKLPDLSVPETTE